MRGGLTRACAQNNEKQQAGANAKMAMIEDLLPLIDAFELAASQVRSRARAGSVGVARSAAAKSAVLVGSCD